MGTRYTLKGDNLKSWRRVAGVPGPLALLPRFRLARLASFAGLQVGQLSSLASFQRFVYGVDRTGARRALGAEAASSVPTKGSVVA